MYTQCFGSLRWCEWPNESTLTLTLLGLCRWGTDFGLLGVHLSLRDVVVVTSWLRLQQASDWIPHPYWMYAKCFRSLRWCEWPYEFTLTLIGLCRWGADFGFLGLDLYPSDVVMS